MSDMPGKGYATKNSTTHLQPFKMDGNNFNMWSKQFIMTVTSKGKRVYLDGKETELDEDLYPTENKKWTTANAIVHSWILNNLSRECCRQPSSTQRMQAHSRKN